MPTLNWIGKDAVEHHHAEVPYRLVHCDGDLSAGNPDAGNLLVQGDNLEALKALLPYYGGQVKCIYIDPPYNTGNEGWVYNDNVASPEIKAWLGKVVGKEAEDLSRHDKWLCMMYPRLRLLREFLREDGVIFVSIDDNELTHLTSLMYEVFGKSNWLGTICWKNATDNNPSRIVIEHEYIVCFAKAKDKVTPHWKSPASPIREFIQEKAKHLVDELPGIENNQERQKKYREWFKEQKPYLWPFQEYDEIDERSVFTGSRSVHNPGKEGYVYDILHPKTGKPTKKPLMGYRFPEETRDRLLEEKRFIFGADEDKIVELKVYIEEWKSKLSSLYDLDGRRGSNEIKDILFEKKRPFSTPPKPIELLSDLISFVTTGDDIVLDSFAGSGSTGHAVLDLNKSDEQQRRFILVEMDEGIASQITAERLRRVAGGYNKKGDPSKPVEGLGGGFRYCRLGVPLFNEFGDIDTAVSFPDLAAHIFFAETGVPIPSKATGISPYLGKHGGKAVYLLFAPGQEGMPREAMGNVLTPDALANLPAPPEGFEGSRVVYAEGCTVSPDRLKSEGVVFKQIPYQVEGV
ncbi:site-specific DNA-methyltransferase [Sagittula sp. MA-2]|jgi:DNA modification methylase|uniref:site-specific DNA-methyltransferase n=1 Tax=Sagittula sp. MA-2 TaxID=3048007 RepID=UPI0024C299BE|nr:site-specific DNA-methyltransferase [Sagittula sp. MA-2]WHZ37329.1 site-specific DNA-methyltransferase [Sagittula sp. MA-2]